MIRSQPLVAALAALTTIVFHLFCGEEKNPANSMTVLPDMAGEWQAVLEPMSLPSDTGEVVLIADSIILVLNLVAVDSSSTFRAVTIADSELIRNEGTWSVPSESKVRLAGEQCLIAGQPVPDTMADNCSDTIDLAISPDGGMTINIANMYSSLVMLGINIDDLLSDPQIGGIVSAMTIPFTRQ